MVRLKVPACLLLSCALATFLILPASVAAKDGAVSEGLEPIATLDLVKARGIGPEYRYPFLLHAMGPTAEALQTHAYRGDVARERKELAAALAKFVKDPFRPTPEQLAQAVALTGLWDDSDYLFLQYRTPSGYLVQIHDGRSLDLLITVPQGVPLDQSRALLLDVAERVLDTSESELAEVGPHVYTDRKDIGRSRMGVLNYGVNAETRDPDWYMGVGWWTDGKLVLLGISKVDFKAMMKQASRSQPVPPRKFASRARAAGAK
jgi:hypothetical protein